MSSPNVESTTNLLLAAYLIVGGATLMSLEEAGKFTRINLDLGTLSKEGLVGHATQLATLAQGVKTSVRAWEEVFDYSFLSRVDREYQQLKRLISSRRTKGQ